MGSEAGAVRPDANRLALAAVRAILDASHAFVWTVEGRTARIEVQRGPVPSWPAGGIEGLDPSHDGPMPSAVRVVCNWDTGSANLLLRVSWWTSGTYRHLVGLRVGVEASDQELVWITFALPLRRAADGEEAVLPATFTPFRRRDEKDDVNSAIAPTIKRGLMRAGLPFASQWKIEVGRVAVPGGAVLPAPEESFERLVKLALVKLPFFVRPELGGLEGEPLLEAEASLKEAPSEGEARREGLYPLPGGVRQYKDTLDDLLREIANEPMTSAAFDALIRERYDAPGEVARRGYANVLRTLGFCAVENGVFALTDLGASYLANPDPDVVFERLRARYSGMTETLVITEQVGAADSAQTLRLLKEILGASWKTANQSSFRRNWLLSIGYVDRTPKGDVLTEAGRRALGRHEEEADEVRQALRAALEAEPPPELTEISEDEAESVEAQSSAAEGTPLRPAAWTAGRLDLREALVVPFAGHLEIPRSTLTQMSAALSSGKHLLLVGPPGTGKTELAHAVAEAARSEGYCDGLFSATATADWTTFDTIGGYALQKDGSLKFRSGVLLRAIERCQWLLLDELNRADVDRAFGELLTVLSGRASDTSYELPDGRLVRIGPDPQASHYMPPPFRIIATMNTWDKTSLFRLSYAVQRRFAIVHVGLPDDEGYARLLRRHDKGGLEPALEDAATLRLTSLFSRSGLLAIRAIGPAVALDVIRYVRRRQAGGDGLSEALAMYVLPQLEGLDEQPALSALKSMLRALNGWSSPEATDHLRARFSDIFPHVTLPAA